MVDENSKVLTVKEQCSILELPRSVYYKKRSLDKDPHRKDALMEAKELHDKHCDTVLDQWTKFPTYGYIKMSNHLLREGYDWATEYAIRRIYKELGLKGLAPKFITTRPSKKGYGKFQYLLRNRKVRYVNEVWATDITYIKLGDKMVYYTAVIDLFSRKILSWRLSRTMDVGFCLDVLQEALENYGTPAIFNTDCGSQYTSKEFISVLLEHGIQVSMDGIGRCKDNIFVERTWRTLKYEWIFLRDYTSYEQLEGSLGEFERFFNHERLHQSLGYKTPEEVYKEGSFPERITRKKVA